MPAPAMLTAVSMPSAEPAGELPPPLVSRRTRDTVLLALRCLYPCKPQRLQGETLILQRQLRFAGVRHATFQESPRYQHVLFRSKH